MDKTETEPSENPATRAIDADASSGRLLLFDRDFRGLSPSLGTPLLTAYLCSVIILRNVVRPTDWD